MDKFITRILVFLFFSSSVAAQTTVSIPAAADNTIYQNPASNSNALGQNIFSGTNGNSSPRRGLIKFDVAAMVPAGAIITSATLTLNCNLSRAVPDDVSLHKVLASWGEGTSNAGSQSDGNGTAATTNDATWLARFFSATTWAAAGGDCNATASATVSIDNTGFYQWASTALVADVQSWVNTPATNFGWMLICNEATASTARKFGSKENATVANRPSLSVTYQLALPVTLIDFKAKANGKTVEINWETLQETNNHYFELLHGSDGVTFLPIARIIGHGTTTVKHTYSFAHEQVPVGNHFYKLAQVDLDGKQKYTAVEKVSIAPNSATIHIFPNPVLDGFKIVADMDLHNATYKIINQSGSVATSGKVGLADIKADALMPGTYYLCIYNKNNGLINKVRFCKM